MKCCGKGETYATRITVNAYSYTIITAHSIRNMSIIEALNEL